MASQICILRMKSVIKEASVPVACWLVGSDSGSAPALMHLHLALKAVPETCTTFTSLEILSDSPPL